MPALRIGVLLIVGAEAVAWLGALAFPELWEWPLLASAHGNHAYRFLSLQMASLGGMLVGAGFVMRIAGSPRAR